LSKSQVMPRIQVNEEGKVHCRWQTCQEQSPEEKWQAKGTHQPEAEMSVSGRQMKAGSTRNGGASFPGGPE
jgi:hypothetical protein